MVGELVTAATILAGSGAGTWLADKLLGPSAEGLGEQLKIFAGDRLRKIFSRADELSRNETVKSLPPGFAVQAIQKASFSEDDDAITDMWANLLLDAGHDYKTKHNLFADILSQLGSGDARALNVMVPADYQLEYPTIVPVNIRSSIRSLLEHEATTDVLTQEVAGEITTKLNFYKPYWPSRVTNVSVPYKEFGAVHWYGGGSGVSVSDEVLIRQQLIDRFQFDLQVTMPSISVEGLIVTGLGLEFLSVCRQKS